MELQADAYLHFHLALSLAAGLPWLWPPAALQEFSECMAQDEYEGFSDRTCRDPDHPFKKDLQSAIRELEVYRKELEISQKER